MNLSRLAIPGLFFQLLCFSEAQGQPFPDTALFKESFDNLRQIYLNQIGDNAQIYHGAEYIRNGQKAVGFPFYESEKMLIGEISYQGTIYPDRNLLYDLVTDDLITNNFAHTAQISLAPEKVDSFRIGNHVFIPLLSEKLKGLPRDGYYEELYSGYPALYSKREKRLVSGTGSEEAKYIQFNSYYIKLNNVYYAVEGKNSLLEIFKDKEDDLKKYIRNNKLNFKKNLESSLLLTTIYYSQLKH